MYSGIPITLCTSTERYSDNMKSYNVYREIMTIKVHVLSAMKKSFFDLINGLKNKNLLGRKTTDIFLYHISMPGKPRSCVLHCGADCFHV
jgi:hypothetical protein